MAATACSSGLHACKQNLSQDSQNHTNNGVFIHTDTMAAHKQRKLAHQLHHPCQAHTPGATAVQRITVGSSATCCYSGCGVLSQGLQKLGARDSVVHIHTGNTKKGHTHKKGGCTHVGPRHAWLTKQR